MGEAIEIDFGVCATVSLAEAAKVLGVHRSTAWELYNQGRFPFPVLKVGSRLRVAKHHLAHFISGEGISAPTGAERKETTSE